MTIFLRWWIMSVFVLKLDTNVHLDYRDVNYCHPNWPIKTVEFYPICQLSLSSINQLSIVNVDVLLSGKKLSDLKLELTRDIKFIRDTTFENNHSENRTEVNGWHIHDLNPFYYLRLTACRTLLPNTHSIFQSLRLLLGIEAPILTKDTFICLDTNLLR